MTRSPRIILGDILESIDLIERYTEVPWRSVAGLRDILIHQYARVDLDLTWSAVEKRLPGLKDQVARILAELDQE